MIGLPAGGLGHISLCIINGGNSEAIKLNGLKVVVGGLGSKTFEYLVVLLGEPAKSDFVFCSRFDLHPQRVIQKR